MPCAITIWFVVAKATLVVSSISEKPSSFNYLIFSPLSHQLCTSLVISVGSLTMLFTKHPPSGVRVFISVDVSSFTVLDTIFPLTCVISILPQYYPLSFVMNLPIPCFLLETNAPSQRSPLAQRYLPFPVLYPLTQSPKYWSPLGQMACPSPVQSLDEFPVFPSALVNWQGAPPSSSAIQVSILRQVIDIHDSFKFKTNPDIQQDLSDTPNNDI